MLDIKFIEQNKDLIINNSKDRGVIVEVDKLISIANNGGEILKQIEEKRALRNKTSKTKPTPEEITGRPVTWIARLLVTQSNLP